MARPLHRGISGMRLSVDSHDLWDSQMKDKPEKEDLDRCASDSNFLAPRFPFKVLLADSNSPSKFGNSENGFVYESFGIRSPRSGYKLALQLLKLSLVLILVLAVSGSFWWTVTISTSSQAQILHSYRRLQEQLVSDLWHVGDLSLGSSRSKELEFCSQESENYGPCFNSSESLALGFSDSSENDRHCEHETRQTSKL